MRRRFGWQRITSAHLKSAAGNIDQLRFDRYDGISWGVGALAGWLSRLCAQQKISSHTSADQQHEDQYNTQQQPRLFRMHQTYIHLLELMHRDARVAVINSISPLPL